MKTALHLLAVTLFCFLTGAIASAADDAAENEAVEQAEQIFKLIDTDGEKKIGLKEFIFRSPEARFKPMDRDNDGKVTWDEFKAGQKPPVKPAKKAVGKKFQPKQVESAVKE